MIEYGSKAVKKHADDTGLSEGISAIVRAFGKESIKDIEIMSPGRKSALKEYSKESVRIAVAARADETIKQLISATKAKK